DRRARARSAYADARAARARDQHERSGKALRRARLRRERRRGVVAPLAALLQHRGRARRGGRRAPRPRGGLTSYARRAMICRPVDYIDKPSARTLLRWLRSTASVSNTPPRKLPNRAI